VLFVLKTLFLPVENLLFILKTLFLLVERVLSVLKTLFLPVENLLFISKTHFLPECFGQKSCAERPFPKNTGDFSSGGRRYEGWAAGFCRRNSLAPEDLFRFGGEEGGAEETGGGTDGLPDFYQQSFGKTNKKNTFVPLFQPAHRAMEN
jgi:hypothetical protein